MAASCNLKRLFQSTNCKRAATIGQCELGYIVAVNQKNIYTNFFKGGENIKKLISIILAVVCVFSLTSCDMIQLYPEELMRPPVFSEEQREIYNALYKTLGNNFILQYPSSGKNRSAILITDIDENGEEEALVFYKRQADSDVRINVLTHSETGWRSACDVSGYSGDVFEIDFVKISDNNSTSVIVGFDQGKVNTNTMIVYEYIEKRLMPIYIRDYSAAEVFDINDDNLNELVVINNNFTSRNSYATILSVKNGNMIVGDEVKMNEDVSGYLNIKGGKMPSGQAALCIDSQLSSGSVITEILTYQNGAFSNLSYGYDSVLIETSMRQNGIMCEDVNGDSVVEIPVTLEPFYESLTDTVQYTAWKQFNGSDIYTVSTSAENLSYGYRVLVPQEWVDNKLVVVKSIISNNEWRFLGFSEEDNEFNETVLSIRVYSQDEIIDMTSLTGYTKFASNGKHSYYAYIPNEVNEKFQINIEQLKDMFQFLQ